MDKMMVYACIHVVIVFQLSEGYRCLQDESHAAWHLGTRIEVDD